MAENEKHGGMYFGEDTLEESKRCFSEKVGSKHSVCKV